MLFPFDATPTDADRVAFKMCASGETVTFAELDDRANQVAHVLRDCGVAGGEHVAILMGNQRELLEVCFGADRAGVYYTTISTRLLPEEVAYIVRDCGAKLLLVAGDLGELATTLQALLPVTVRCFVSGAVVAGVADWDSKVGQAPKTAIPNQAQGLDMLYSSGSTGRPKGVKWPLLASPAGGRTMMVDLLQPLFHYGGSDCRYLSTAPLYHAGPLRHCMTVIKLGGTAFVMDRFDAEQALALIECHKITHSQWVPTMFVRMLKLPEAVQMRYDVSSLRVAVHAAAPCPVDVKRQMLNWWGPVIYEYYAGTENNGFCSIGPTDWLTHPGSVGRASQGTLHICDEDGVEVAPGEIGVVYFADGPEFIYHGDPSSTAKSRNAQGWTTLGDIGRLDDEGYLYLVDRRSFMIISGGVNIYPQEAESVLIGHPKVADVAVIGVPNQDFGEEVKAVVQLVNGEQESPALAEELIDYCKVRLASYKCPRSVDFDPALPRHPTGKLYKQLLRQRYWPNP